MNDTVVIGGTGIVGRATMLAFGITDQISLDSQTITWEAAKHKKYVFICLPTPVLNGEYQLDEMTKVIEKVSSTNNIVIVRSTVTPGYCRKMEALVGSPIASNPEFLTESTWEADAKYPKMLVIGADSPKVRDDVFALYRGRYSYMAPIITDTITAEMIKLVFNCWFSTKVMFFNEIYDIAQKQGANYETIRKAIENHPWGAKHHTQAIFKDKRGIRGRCLPKDLEAFAQYSGSRLLQTIHDMNRRFL